MADWDRERQGRQSEDDSDWDWYYYEYRWEPYTYGRDYGQNYRRSSGQDYGRNYGRDYRRGSGQDYGQQGQDYERGSQGNYGSSGMAGNWNRGRYSGVGPRGYQRSDERIREDVNDRLTWHGQIDASEVMVDVKDGVVTLSGSVNNRREKRLAEDIVDSVPGVTDVQNNLRVENQRSQNREEGGTQAGQQSQNQETMEGTSRKRR